MLLLSSKYDFLNFQLIEKLASANHTLLIENQNDLIIQSSFVEYFENHKKEMLIKEKIKWRSNIFTLFKNEFTSDEASQFELSQLGWKVFSKMNSSQAKKYMDVDKDLFQRSMNISTNYTLCALLLGYYDDAFLSTLFTETFLNLIDINHSGTIEDLKKQLETIRILEKLESKDITILDGVFSLSNKKNSLLGERLDGSGYWHINQREMTDLELVFVALNAHYSFFNLSNKTIFNDIEKSNFKCNERVLNTITNSINNVGKITKVEVAA